MNARTSITVTLVAVLASLGVLSGCAKRPSLTQAAAPPPTGAAEVRPAPPTPPPALSPPAPAAPAPPTPAAAPPPRAKPAEFAPTSALRAIHFDFDKSSIRTGDAAILDANAAWLTTNPQYLVLIEGHCDERGTNEYNLALGERRARAARDYLVARGVPASRLLMISYGEERPECTEHSEACWARNRQARFLTKAQ